MRRIIGSPSAMRAEPPIDPPDEEYEAERDGAEDDQVQGNDPLDDDEMVPWPFQGW